MLYYLKKYPISLTIIAVVIYLSFFKPPSLEVGKIVGIDKVAHLCMYAGLSGMLWIECSCATIANTTMCCGMLGSEPSCARS